MASPDGSTRHVRLGRRSHDDAERTRRTILAAALALFATRGFDAVGIRDIADEADTTHGLIRHHFGSKDDIWRAVVDAADADFVTAMRPVLEQADADPDPEGALATVVHGVVHTAATHPQIVRLLVREGTAGGGRLTYILERVVQLQRAIAPLARRLRDHGLLHHFDDDEFFLFILLAGSTPFALSALSTSVLDADVLTHEYAERHADRLVRMLLSRR